MNYVGVSELAKKYNKSESFMNMILCRSEFGQYRKDDEDGYFKFKDDVDFNRQIRFVLRQKKNMYGKTCRGAYWKYYPYG